MDTYIVKLDGTQEVFALDKIKNAIAKSFLAAGSLAKEETLVSILGHLRIYSGITVEEIQNQVEVALMQEGYYHVAKTYMLLSRPRYCGELTMTESPCSVPLMGTRSSAFVKLCIP